MRSLTKEEKAFTDMLASEMAAMGMEEATEANMRKALNSIHNRMWQLLNNDSEKRKAAAVVALPLWTKTQMEKAIRGFDFIAETTN